VTTLFDTGPLVAAIDRSDEHYLRCAAFLETAARPLIIPTTVIVEVCWLVEERPDIEAAFLTAIAAGEFTHAPLTASDLARMADLVRTYADLPLGAVDASVIAIAERLNLKDIATLDRFARFVLAGSFYGRWSGGRSCLLVVRPVPPES
jgi:uncharacterized protein